jgi:hypothetical protein
MLKRQFTTIRQRINFPICGNVFYKNIKEILNEVGLLILRKVLIAMVTGGIIILITSVVASKVVGIIMGMYILPILLLFGVPVSLFSDHRTKSKSGFIRGLFALLIHLSFAILSVLIPLLLSGWKGNNIFTDFYVMLDDYLFFILASIICSSLFWFIDEFIRCYRNRWIRQDLN